MSLNFTNFANESNKSNEFMSMINEDMYYRGDPVSPDVLYIFIGTMFGLIFLSSLLIQGKYEVEETIEEVTDEEEECIIFPDTLQVFENGDLYIFSKYKVTFDEDGNLHVITGKLLKKLERKERSIERRHRRNEQRLMEAEELRIRQENLRLQEEQQIIEMNRIADETHLQELITELSAIVENRQQDNSKSKRKTRSFSRPLDYGHRYLNDRDQLTTTLRGQTADVLYRKGASPKEDRYITVFAGDTQPVVFNTLNKVAAGLAVRVAINGPNAWTAFKRVIANGQLESIDRLDRME